MGKSQRRKGHDGEREVVNLLKDSGFKAKRISMMETGGLDKGDVDLDGVAVSVKIGKQVPKFIYDAMRNGEAYTFLRKDRMQWIVAMPIHQFIALYTRKQKK